MSQEQTEKPVEPKIEVTAAELERLRAIEEIYKLSIGINQATARIQQLEKQLGK